MQIAIKLYACDITSGVQLLSIQYKPIHGSLNFVHLLILPFILIKHHSVDKQHLYWQELKIPNIANQTIPASALSKFCHMAYTHAVLAEILIMLHETTLRVVSYYVSYPCATVSPKLEVEDIKDCLTLDT